MNRGSPSMVNMLRIPKLSTVSTAFADDTSLFSSDKDLKFLVEKNNQELSKLSTCMVQNEQIIFECKEN